MTDYTLDLRIPLSLTPSLVNRARLTIDSVKRYYSATHTTLYITPTPYDSAAEAKRLLSPDIAWHFIDSREREKWENTNNKFAAGICDRFRPPFDAPHVLMLDADVLCLQKFDELFQSHALQSMMAHVGPFGLNNTAIWYELFSDFGVEPPLLLHELTGYPFMTPVRYAPPYFNTGVVFSPADLLTTISASFFEAVEFLRKNMDSYFVDQIALTLALAKHPDIAVNCLGLEYNFPNDPSFDAAYPNALKSPKFLHFLRQGIIDRDTDFKSRTAIANLVSRRDLQGSNEIFRQHIEELTSTWR